MRRERALKIAMVVATGALTALLMWPASWAKGSDSFPLSPYPMFARKKTSAMLVVDYAIVVNDKGQPSFVPPRYFGSEEVLQVRAIIQSAMNRGVGTRTALCEKVMKRLHASKGTAEVAELRFVRGTHDSVAYLQGDKSKSKEEVLTRCH